MARPTVVARPAFLLAVQAASARADGEIVRFPVTSHSFDWLGSWEFRGRKGWHDPAATADAYERAGEFLERYLE